MDQNSSMNIVPDGTTDGLLSALSLVIPALVVLRHRRPTTPLPVGGPAVIAVSALALVVRAVRVEPSGVGQSSYGFTLVAALCIGAGLAWAGGRFGHEASLPPVLRGAAVLPGALVAVWGLDVGDRIWIPVVATVFIAIAGPAADTVDDRLGRDGMALTMIAMSVLGILVTVPETQRAAPVAGALVVLAVLGWPLGLVRLGAGGGCAAVCILTMLTIDGGWIRTGAVIGGLAAIGLLSALVLHPRFPGRERHGQDWWRTAGLLVLHALVTLAVTRVSGMRDSAWEAVFSAVLFVAAGTATAGPLLSSGSLRR